MEKMYSLSEIREAYLGAISWHGVVDALTAPIKFNDGDILRAKEEPFEGLCYVVQSDALVNVWSGDTRKDIRGEVSDAFTRDQATSEYFDLVTPRA